MQRRNANGKCRREAVCEQHLAETERRLGVDCLAHRVRRRVGRLQLRARARAAGRRAAAQQRSPVSTHCQICDASARAWLTVRELACHLFANRQRVCSIAPQNMAALRLTMLAVRVSKPGGYKLVLKSPVDGAPIVLDVQQQPEAVIDERKVPACQQACQQHKQLPANAEYRLVCSA